MDEADKMKVGGVHGLAEDDPKRRGTFGLSRDFGGRYVFNLHGNLQDRYY